jgi:hypothetical protein
MAQFLAVHLQLILALCQTVMISGAGELKGCHCISILIINVKNPHFVMELVCSRRQPPPSRHSFQRELVLELVRLPHAARHSATEQGSSTRTQIVLNPLEAKTPRKNVDNMQIK